MNEGKDYRNSVGYFRDPFTGKEFDDAIIKAPRVPGHKFAHIYASDGKTVIPISSRFWTREEKDAYYASRKNGSSGSGPQKTEELRQSLNELREYLESVLPNDKKVRGMIDKMMPADPAIARMQKQVESMSEEQKQLFLAMLNK
ncbi:hypothetical protein HDR60_03120 [bacterium]|nr:hypothetical protein [bacterium]